MCVCVQKQVDKMCNCTTIFIDIKYHMNYHLRLFRIFIIFSMIHLKRYQNFEILKFWNFEIKKTTKNNHFTEINDQFLEYQFSIDGNDVHTNNSFVQAKLARLN